MTGTGGQKPTVPATVALTAVTLSVVLGFGRVFDSTRFLLPLSITAALAHGCAAGTRALRTRLAGPIMVVAGVVVTVGASSWSSTTWGIPTPSAIRSISHELHLAWQALTVVVTPTSPTTGFLFASAVAIWVAAWLGDRLAFRFGAPVEALAPISTIFLFCTLLAGPHWRFASTAVFGAAVLVYVLVERTLRRMRRSGVLRAGRGDLGGRTIALGMSSIAAAVVVGITSVVAVPSLQSGGLIEVRSHRLDDAPRSVVSPLVDIRSRLLEQRNDVMFDVTAARAAYWRLMSLDSFDGTIWSSNQHFRSAGTKLRSGGVSTTGDPNTIPIEATFDLTGLGGPWAPAPFRASGVHGTDQLLWDPSGATLIVRAARGDVGDLRYRVTALAPVVSAANAGRAHGPVPSDIRSTDLALPTDFPDDLMRLAHQIVAKAATPYEKAMALQAYFRDNDHFRYSTEVGSGQDIDAMRNFLQRGSGYCEQFAGTYAALARAAGLPARVAVGFTSGEPTGPDRYTVYGRNAHAWPEVYLAGLGWLPFEPTPGRGNPDARSYTGIVPQQAGPGDGPSETVPTPTNTPPTTDASVPTTTVARTPSPTLAPAIPNSPVPPPTKPGGPIVPGWLTALLGGVIVVLLLTGTGPLLRRWRRRQRRDADPSPAGRVRSSWADVLDDWAPDRVERRPADTDLDVGRRLATHLESMVSDPALASTALRLADLSTTATWHAAGVDAADADEADQAATRLRQAANNHRPALRRFLIWIDPRPPVGRTRGKRAQSS